MELQGTIIAMLPIMNGTSAKGAWSSQDYILETNDQYPKKVCVNAFGDSIEKFNLQIGDKITAGINIESREYNGRWFTSVKLWKVDKQSDQQQAPQTTAPVPPSEGSDLPF